MIDPLTKYIIEQDNDDDLDKAVEKAEETPKDIKNQTDNTIKSSGQVAI